jgi:glycosyltransferase involved in cell wall biosynthesis
MILFDSIYIHQGGGRTILNILISNILENNSDDYFFIIDQRYNDDILKKIPKEKFSILSSSELSRRGFYLKNHKKFNTFFCLANVPPPIYIYNKKVIVYFQNELLLKSNPFHLKNLILWIKRQYIFSLKLSNYKWVVQTNLMKDKLARNLKISKSLIKIFPIFPKLKKVNSLKRSTQKFIYVASGENHKNHKRLIDAMGSASSRLNKPIHLYLTLTENKFNSLIKGNNKNNPKLMIKNLGLLKQDMLYEKYSELGYLIYPSLYESFGLPLVEAAQLDLVVIASDLPYVNEIISNYYSFDPLDINDISLIIEKVVNLNDPNTSLLKIKSEEIALINYINDLS